MLNYAEPRFFVSCFDSKRTMAKASQRAIRTILFAEDEPLLRELGETILSQAGYKVLTAGQPQQLLSFLDQYSGSIDLLLTDVAMPGLSGQELARLARVRWPGIRVLYTSGYSNDELDGLMQDAGFLQKPFTPTELMAKVKKLIEA